MLTASGADSLGQGEQCADYRVAAGMEEGTGSRR